MELNEQDLRIKAKSKISGEVCDVLLICFVNRYVSVLPLSNIEGGAQVDWNFCDIELVFIIK